ncbi:MAG: tetratricopeptide repeat protein [Myxococcota bacterium]
MLISAISGLLMLALSVPALAEAAEAAEATEARVLGFSLAAEGRCEAAIETLLPLRTTPPGDAGAERVTGECAIRLQQFDLAVEALEAARALDAEEPDLDLHLAMAYFHRGEWAEAEAALARAEETAANRPQYLLYSGLIAYEQSDYETAIGRLDAASQLSDRPVEPMASFFLGRAFGQDDQKAEAEAAFSKITRDFPESPWAGEAQRAIDELETKSEMKWWASVELGYEYDGNALLRGRGVGLPEEISNESDHRGFWFVDTGAELFDWQGWKGGATLRYGGSEHHELDEFDAHAPGGTLWLDRDLGVYDASLRLQYDVDAAWIGGDPFVVSQLGTASVFKPWNSGGFSLVGMSVGFDDYRYDRQDVQDARGAVPAGTACTVCSPVGVNEVNETDRDGVSWRVSLRHREPLKFLDYSYFSKPYLEGEYLHSRYWSEGQEYDNQRHQAELSFGVELPFAIQLRATGRYAYVPYDNRSSFPDPDDIPIPPLNGDNEVAYPLDPRNRKEQEVGVRVVLERAFGENILVRARWSRTEVYSTSDVFEYDRDLFGVSVRVGFGS